MSDYKEFAICDDAVERDPIRAADLIIAHITDKGKKLGLNI